MYDDNLCYYHDVELHSSQDGVHDVSVVHVEEIDQITRDHSEQCVVDHQTQAASVSRKPALT